MYLNEPCAIGIQRPKSNDWTVKILDDIHKSTYVVCLGFDFMSFSYLGNELHVLVFSQGEKRRVDLGAPKRGDI